MSDKPLNGEKTHPLSPAAKAVLADLARGPMPRSEINPGVVNRLQREGVVEIVDLPSPFKSHNGKPVSHLRLIASATKDEPDQCVRCERCGLLMDRATAAQNYNAWWCRNGRECTLRLKRIRRNQATVGKL